ncbi:hypothetical protein AMTR_s00012p00222080 [Amborella trichopoda]|uniref:Disease resistance R13L4/SHOC-2-like LRR domain-containing protein n=2 Tax=Amborella trichopoda TaxID=13333 RepID=W1PJF7_AMBTC|nr:hypothetical protein AMTR_s00012p00222080 [Amborella trichopoda]
MHALMELDRSHSGIAQLPDSIGNLTNLRKLYMRNTMVREPPHSLGALVNLEVLIVSQCKVLSKFPASMERMTSLHLLNMEKTAVATLPNEFGYLSNLESLYMSECEQLKEFRESFGSRTSSEFLHIPHNINLTTLSSTSSLNASNCNLKGMISDDFEELSSLKTLDLSKTNFQGLLRSIRGLSQLESPTIKNCKQLVAIPELPNSPKHLDASGCKSLQTLPKLSHISKLAKLLICECRRLEDIPDLHTSLEYLDPRGCQCLLIVPKPSHLSKLERLDFSDCKRLFTISDLPATLKTLYASNCNSLQNIPNLSHLSQLEVLDLTTCTRLTEIQGLSGLKSLRALHLSGCSPHILQLIRQSPHQAKYLFDSPADSEHEETTQIRMKLEGQWLMQTRGQKQLSLEASGKYLQKIITKQQMFSGAFNTGEASDELVPHASVTRTSKPPICEGSPFKKEKVVLELWDNDSNTSKTNHVGSMANEEEEHHQHIMTEIANQVEFITLWDYLENVRDKGWKLGEAILDQTQGKLG